MKTNKLCRLCAFALALVIIAGILPPVARATESIGVTVSAQAAGDYLLPRTELQVTPGLAEEYGYQNSSSIPEGQATMLDALVALHLSLFGEDFTENSASEYLSVSSGSISKIFGESTYNIGFAKNGEQPHGDIWTEGSGGYPGYYNAYTVSDAPVNAGDSLEYFIFRDSWGMDMYSGFELNGSKVEALSASVGEEITLTLKGYSIGWYGSSDSATIQSMTSPICDAQLALIDGYGVRTDINGALTDSEDGTVTVKFDEEGTYILSAYVTDEDISENYATPIIMPWCEITVGDTAITPPETGGEDNEDEEIPSNPPADEEPVSAEDMPSSVDGYLPAPGQFVNVDLYADPVKTLDASSGNIVTLGAFGGSVTYYFEDAVKNDPKNPYGIDFIVYGNTFRNSDGSSSASASEPGAVAVSENGEDWYELAGSVYWERDTTLNSTVTYTNTDTSFEAYADISWQASDGSQGTLSKSDYYTQPYYPNPEYYSAFNSGKSANEGYTAESVSFTGTRFESKLSPVYGYADSHASSSPLSNQAVNPYVKEHYQNTNGDGMDLSWAVDQNGERVELSQIHYIKIYNPTLYDGGSTGEISPEISGVLRAKPRDAEVGTTAPLTGLLINGAEIALTDGVYDYSFDANGASTLAITPAGDADANIYVNNTWVAPGETTDAFIPGDKVCIMVQSGERAPLRYIISVSDISEPEKCTALKSVSVIPGDLKATAGEENVYSLTVGNSTSSIRVQAIPFETAASVTVDGEEAAPAENWVSSKIISLTPGETAEIPISVTSADESVTVEYTLKVTRREASSSGGSSPSNNITVYFTLKGDSVHGTPEAHSRFETWISKKSYSVPDGATVKYLTDKVLIENKIDFSASADGTYITSIKGLAETSNGPNSGWMYKLNGSHDGVDGYAEQTLSSGDTVEWHYTDDYTKEDDMDEWSGSSYGGSYSGSSDNTKEEESGTAEETAGVYMDTKGHWAEKSIEFVSGKGILMGTGANTFTPDGKVTRAMLAVILHRLEGTPSSGAPGFGDVSRNTWYTSAVAWAAEQEIVNGVGNNSFAPDTAISREAFAVMLYRYANMQGKDTSGHGDLSAFSDADMVSDWAEDAIAWAVHNNLLGGKGNGRLDPAGYLTRAEAAAVLERWINA